VSNRQVGHQQASKAHHDVVVIGGGISGASILFHLAGRGIDAALFERTHLASGPTGRSSANVRMSYFMPQLAELANRGRTFYRNFGEITGGDCSFVQVGVLYGIGQDQATAFQANVGALRARGFEISVLDTQDIATLAPGFDLTGIAMGMWEATSGYADPVGATVGLAKRATELGASVHLNTPISRIAAAGGRVIGVETAIGSHVSADVVIVAAGPWTRELVRQLGIDLPLHVERHTVTVLDTIGPARHVVPWVWADFPGGYYARPEGPSSLLIAPSGSTPPIADPDTFPEGVSIEESASVLTRAATRIPGVARLGIKGGWAGLYDMSPDRLHIVDAMPGVAGLYVVAGTSGHGFKLAPAIGEEVARLVATGRSDLLQPFRLDRSFDPELEQQPR
jgi:sarcosine oxidase, subunit beta